MSNQSKSDQARNRAVRAFVVWQDAHGRFEAMRSQMAVKGPAESQQMMAVAWEAECARQQWQNASATARAA